jgi:hypothetical protein
MTLPGETEAGSAGTQPCRGIAWRAHRDDADERACDVSRSFPNPIGSKDPHALKIPARRAECSLTENALSPFHAEPGQLLRCCQHDKRPGDSITHQTNPRARKMLAPLLAAPTTHKAPLPAAAAPIAPLLRLLTPAPTPNPPPPPRLTTAAPLSPRAHLVPAVRVPATTTRKTPRTGRRR